MMSTHSQPQPKASNRINQWLVQPAVYKWFSDPFERAIKTFFQVFAVGLLTTRTTNFFHPDEFWAEIAKVAAFSAIISLLLSYLAVLVTLSKLTGYADMFVRAVKTFISTYLGLVFTNDVVNSHTAQWNAALGVASTAAIASLLTSLATIHSPFTVGGSAVRQPVNPPDTEAPLSRTHP